MKQLLRPETYQAVFGDQKGQHVLEELSLLFYDIESYSRGDSHETAFKEGQRYVLRFILAKLGQVTEQGEEHAIQE